MSARGNLDKRFLFDAKSLTGVGKVDKNTDVIKSKQLLKFTFQSSVYSFKLNTTITISRNNTTRITVNV